MADELYSTLRPFDALSPRGPRGKREYVLELEKKGDQAAVLLLVECLADESGYLRDLAAAALVRLAAPAAPILPLLASGLWYTRSSAVRTLGRLAGARGGGAARGPARRREPRRAAWMRSRRWPRSRARAATCTSLARCSPAPMPSAPGRCAT
jgi:hypothetical protein